METPPDNTPLSDEEIGQMMNEYLDAQKFNSADAPDTQARDRLHRASLRIVDNPGDAAAFDEFILARRAADPNLPRLRRLVDEE